jgi:pyruvate formate lyase activating enzyme
MKEALYYERLKDQTVRCLLCPHRCVISPSHSGICGARRNLEGKLYTLNYGVVAGMNIDPIEKKPLYHYYPGSLIFSIGTVGCNLKCPFCQNSHLSRFFDENISPEFQSVITPVGIFEAVERNVKLYKREILNAISYTYSEPIVWYEYVLETCKIMRKNGYKNVFVTNGYIEQEPLNEILPYIDAANVDLKAFTEENYKKLTGGLKPVLNFIKRLKESGVHVEVTTLVVTDFNDNIKELEELVRWISNLDRKIPFHISRYFPSYKYTKPSTSLEFLHKVNEMALKYLDYVYLGNVMEQQNTYCPHCKNLLVLRNGYDISITGIKDKKCNKCGKDVDFVL